jgi:hypothetical protein
MKRSFPKIGGRWLIPISFALIPKVCSISDNSGSVQPGFAEYTYRYLGDARQIPTHTHRYVIKEEAIARGGFAGQ